MERQGLLTTKELASLIGVSPWTIRRRVKEWAIPFIRFGQNIRFKEGVIDTWLAQRTSNPSPIPESALNVDLQPEKYDKIRGQGGFGEMAKAKSKARYNFGFGAIYQRKTKQGEIRWYLDYRDATGKRVQRIVRHAKTCQEAAEELVRVVREEHIRAGGAVAEKKDIKFDVFADTFFQDYVLPTYKKGMLEKSRMRKLTDFFGGYTLREVTPMMIERFRAERLAAGNKRSTVNRFLALMKRMYTLAINEGLAKENPVKKVKFFSEADNIKERILNPEEEKRLMAVAPPRLRPILVIALNSGLRFSEIMNLEWKHIDFNGRRLRVERTKSKKVRYVNMNNPLLEELLQLRVSANGSPYLFLNPKTGKPFTLVRKSFLTACKKAGIQGLRFHDLRHTFATRLIQKGVDIETVRALLGHYSIVLTQRYTHSNNEMKQRAVDAIGSEPEAILPENGGNLLRPCDTEKNAVSERVQRIPATASESVN
jgi:excisionase family DNA binding protein